MADLLHLRHYATRLTAAAKSVENAIASGDPELLAEAHAAVGRVRERMGPAVGLVMKGLERDRQQAHEQVQGVRRAV